MYLYLYCILVGHANCFRPSCQGFYGQDCGMCEGTTCVTTCPAGMYGKACALCEGAQLEPGHPIVALNACSGHGVCNGNGTAGGDGSCACAHGCVVARAAARGVCECAGTSACACWNIVSGGGPVSSPILCP